MMNHPHGWFIPLIYGKIARMVYQLITLMLRLGKFFFFYVCCWVNGIIYIYNKSKHLAFGAV